MYFKYALTCMFVFTHFQKIDIFFFSVSPHGSYLFATVHINFADWCCSNLYLYDHRRA